MEGQLNVLQMTQSEAEEHLSLDLLTQIGEMGCVFVGILLAEVDDDE